MRISSSFLVVVCAVSPCLASARTLFQSQSHCNPAIDIGTDAIAVYGVDDSFSTRTSQWRDEGYGIHTMTGAAWGQYADYIDGRFDGTTHTEEGQADGKGETIWHHPGVPYMVPTTSYTAYLKSLVHKAIDNGAEAIHMEEPEFWSRAGYSEGFKKMWHQEYGEAWQRPDSSPDAFWRSSRLKYLLYKRTLADVFADAKAYARARGKSIDCYVPTHSLVNYSQWGIVSPESSLMDLQNCDGYIAQVWTGTARTPNVYKGVVGERTFETAFLEFSSMANMVASTGRSVYFLADPVEDDPNHTWDDYRTNYQKTLVASLLFPEVSDYEVMPWPDRVFLSPFPSGTYSKEDKITIPADYASELMTVVNSLNNMKQSNLQWESGSADVGVMISDTMMFQRGNNWGDNGPIVFNAFYGMALPLIKAGIPVKCLTLERCLEPGALDKVNVILISYEPMKPMKPEYHDRLAKWVENGGRLVYIGNDSDPFKSAREWWNSDGKTSGTPRMHLFEKLHAPANVSGGHSWTYGNGEVTWKNIRTADLATESTGPQTVLDLASGKGAKSDRPITTSDHISLRRGPYLTGAVLNETSEEKPVTIKGKWLDLFTSNSATVSDPVVLPGQVFLFRSLNESPGDQPEILATTARVIATTITANEASWAMRGQSSVPVHHVVIRCKTSPTVVSVNGDKSTRWKWNEGEKVIHLDLPYKKDGLTLGMAWN